MRYYYIHIYEDSIFAIGCGTKTYYGCKYMLPQRPCVAYINEETLIHLYTWSTGPAQTRLWLVSETSGKLVLEWQWQNLFRYYHKKFCTHVYLIVVIFDCLLNLNSLLCYEYMFHLCFWNKMHDASETESIYTYVDVYVDGVMYMLMASHHFYGTFHE